MGSYGKLAGMRGLHSDRLALQPLDEAHIRAMHALCLLPDVRRYLFKDQLIPESHIAAMVDASQSCFNTLGIGFFAVEIDEPQHPNHGEFAGFCGIRRFEGGDEIELLFGMDPVVWGSGLGAEAADTVLACGFTECGLEKVIAAADTPNQRSVRVLQKLGMSFRERRVWHGLDTMFYEMTAADYACR